MAAGTTADLKALLKTTRGPFLVLGPVCVALGVSLSQVAAFPWLAFLLALAGAVLSHISVNMLNEYLDYRTGLDLKTARTDFSGGSGALPENPGAARWVLAAALLTLALVVLIGLFFVVTVGPGILWVGVPGVLLVATYTQWLNRQPLLCWLAPGAGFGLCMMPGIQYVLQGSYSAAAWACALVVFFPVNNLLLLNQFPDIEADRSVGRNHLAIAFGTAVAARVYLAGVLAAALALVLAVVFGVLPMAALLALLALLPAVPAWQGARRLGAEIGNEPGYLAANVASALLVPASLALIIWLA